ncbi:unnamed protein product [Brassica oleracea]|uniref:(rape) hypothetical protein n=1 Tax=Brassica napus TaxID=3708 RepID=A0A816KG91_BRANA|nr:unnamed protein product [Brassica napus]
MECTNSLLPLGHYYQPCLQPDLTLGLTKLSDKSLLTVLLQDHVGELQVLHDQYWVDVPPRMQLEHVSQWCASLVCI